MGLIVRLSELVVFFAFYGIQLFTSNRDFNQKLVSMHVCVRS